jgi:thymidylate synthase
MVRKRNPREKPSSKAVAGELRFDEPTVAPMVDAPPTSLANLDEAFVTVLSDLLYQGIAVRAGSSLSVGSEKLTRELLNDSFELSSGRDRLLYNPRKPINLTGALGRFVWMMSGSDRLSDIQYYEPKVTFFSDDGITVPGSNYGTRLFEARPGLNQITNVIHLLKECKHTRRAAATICHPEDTGRKSRDIPCTFGLLYNVRDGLLHSTTIMRSNNAWILLPYNVFEFSLLAEIIAAEVGVEPGPYYHFAASMHIYESDFSLAENALNIECLRNRAQMPRVPIDRPWHRLQELLRYEIQLRTNYAGLNAGTYKPFLKAAEDLGDFWDQLGLILLVHALRKVDERDLCQEVLAQIGEPYKQFLDGHYAAYLQETDLENLLLQEADRIDPKTRIQLHDAIPGLKRLARSLVPGKRPVLVGRLREWLINQSATINNFIRKGQIIKSAEKLVSRIQSETEP